MKKVILTATALMATLSIFAQGKLTFANDANSLVQIKDKVTGDVSVAPSGTTYVTGLWWAPTTVTDPSQFTYYGTSANLFTAGRFNKSYTISAVAPAGAIINVQVRGWENSFGSYDAALAGGGLTDKSGIFTVDTSDPAVATDLVGNILGAGKFTGLTLQVPEPSTIALGLLGLAGLFILRRRS